MSKKVIKKYRFIDLFAGIGGFHLALHNLGCECEFASEWDKYARQTYEANFREISPELFSSGNFVGDIKKIDLSEIPDFDILCAGFPCQPFSLAGVSKKNSLGRKHGFEDETQGTLFFTIKEIIRLKRPKAIFLENVKNIVSHDDRKTFKVICDTLQNKLNYEINWKIIDGANWVPQHRERIFIVGYDREQIDISKEEIIIPNGPGLGYEYLELKNIVKKKLPGYTLGKGTWETLERHKKHHAEKGNGFGYSIINFPIPKGVVTRTISARYPKDGSEALVAQLNDLPRKLSIEEAMQLQGYDPEKFIFPVSKTQAYKQIGNSVVVPAIQSTAKEIIKILKTYDRK